MTPQELKYSIIFAALQGRLAKQNDTETPVDLSAIKQKKTEEIEFDIPENWSIAHLEAITAGIPSKQYQILESEVQQVGEYPVISQSKAYTIGFSSDANKVYHHTNPVIVFGDHTTEVKYVDFDFIVGADGVKIFEPIDGIITASFLFYVFLHYSKDLNKVGGYSRHYKFIKNKPIPIPPLAEQKHIVAKIEELLPYIDRYEQAWSKLEEFNKRFLVDMQKSILQMSIQGKLVEQRPEEGTGEELFQQIQAEKQALIKAGKIKKEKPLPEITEDEIPFDIPESWRWVRLIDLCKSISDGDHQPPPQVPRGIPFLVISNVSSGNVDFSNTRYVPMQYFNNLSDDRIAAKGDVLFTVTGSYGIPVKVDCDQQFCFQRHIALLKLLIAWDYLFYVLKSPVIKSQCDAVATGTAQKTVGLKSLRSMLIPLPPLAEQKRIVAKLEEVLPLCERLK